MVMLVGEMVDKILTSVGLHEKFWESDLPTIIVICLIQGQGWLIICCGSSRWDSPELNSRFGTVLAKVIEVVQLTDSSAYRRQGHKWMAPSRKQGFHSSCTINFSDIMLDPGWYVCGDLVWGLI